MFKTLKNVLHVTAKTRKIIGPVAGMEWIPWIPARQFLYEPGPIAENLGRIDQPANFAFLRFK